jgi:uncharacterized membrane protein YhfC
MLSTFLKEMMLTFALIAELVIVIGFPLLLGAWLQRRFRVSWLLFAAGAITFGLSQAVHLPLNAVIFALVGDPNPLPEWVMALTLGFTAGLCEETARYAAYRWVLRDVRSWREALMFGAGHGGIESVLFVGLIVGVTLLNMAFLQGADLQAWGISAGQTAQLQGQLAGFWGQAWTVPLLAAAERIFSITFHMGMAVLVLQAVVRRRPAYWLLAIGLHTAGNALAVITLGAGWSLIATEGVVGFFALVALGIILAFRPREAEDSEDERPSLRPLPAAPKRPLTVQERLRRQIEDSKYER